MENNSKSKVIKGLILVGGFGTRLRPLTFTKPKPLVEFCNSPTLTYQLEALVKIGVTEVVLAINYQPDKMYEFIKFAEEKYGIKIICSIETEPLGTAGPIGLAKNNILMISQIDELIVFNADITCKYPLADLVNFHRNHGKEGTIMVTRVKEPSRYGVIVTDESNKILRFEEKPLEFISNKINAGIYLFSKEFLSRIEAVPTSIEREIFPSMASDGQLYAMDLEGFWMDIGQPRDFLIGSIMYLENLKQYEREDKQLVSGRNIRGNCLIVYFNIKQLGFDC